MLIFILSLRDALACFLFLFAEKTLSHRFLVSTLAAAGGRKKHAPRKIIFAARKIFSPGLPRRGS
jgi:hypothetical protein